MIKEGEKIDKVIYVVDSHIAINDRVNKIFELRELFKKMVLVKAGHQNIENKLIGISPVINPIALFQRLGLKHLNNFLDRYVFFPSSKIFYVKAVARKLSKLIKRDLNNNNNVCVLLCLPSHDLILIGLLLKRKYPQLKCLIDWQDLWSYDDYYLERIPRYYRKKMFKLESDAFASSDINITTNSYAKKVVEEYYKVEPERVVSINHHFNPEDLETISEKDQHLHKLKRGETIKIGFLGSLFKPPRVPGDKILEAIEYNRKEGVDLELHLYGDATASLKKNASSSNIDGVYAHGRFSHKESIERISKCDLLLLVLSDLPNCSIVMSIKLPHYLLVGKPIIAIVPESSVVAEIIRRTGSGYIIPSSEYHWGKELKNTLYEITSDHLSLTRREDVIESFSWENISKQWLHILKTV
jgi:glycosyltransferase involved in cell wall biosynthesis